MTDEKKNVLILHNVPRFFFMLSLFLNFIQHLLGFRFSELYEIFILMEQTSAKKQKVNEGKNTDLGSNFQNEVDDDAFF